MGPVIIWGGAAAWLHFHGDRPGGPSSWSIYGIVRDQLRRQLREADPHEPRRRPVDAARRPRRLRRRRRLRIHRALRRARRCSPLAWNIFKTWLELAGPRVRGAAGEMKARIKLVEGITFVAESGSGHGVVVDAAPDVGGRNLGARPMELVLMGTGACTAIDVMHILRKARPAGHRLRRRARGRPRRRRPEGLHADPHALHRHGQGIVDSAGGARDQAVEGQVLLGDEDARTATVEISFDFEVREA